MAGMQGPKGPPPPPPSEDEIAERLEAGVESGEIDLETLEARLAETFGSEAGGIVSEDGTVDFEALSSLLVEQREARMQASLAERFGSEAVASVTGEDGEIDHEALRALVGESGTDMPPPPRGGEGGYGPSGGAAGGGRDPLIDLFA